MLVIELRYFPGLRSPKLWCQLFIVRGVVPRGAGSAMVPPDFGRSVNPISIRGGRLCPPNNNGTPEFSDLPTALIGRELYS